MPTLQTVSETELARLTSVDRHRIATELAAAGINPVSEVKRGHATLRLWPRADALRALRQSDATLIKQYRDEDAATKSKIIELRMALKSGTHVLLRDLEYRIDVYCQATGIMFRRQVPHRYAHDVADINRRNLPEPERRAEMRAMFEPTMEEVRKAREKLFHD